MKTKKEYVIGAGENAWVPRWKDEPVQHLRFLTDPTRGRRGQHGAELSTLVVPEQRCFLRADGIEHAEDILDRVLEGRQLMPWEPVRHAHTAPVDRDEARPSGQPVQERGSLWALPHHLDVGDVPLDVDEIDRAVPDDAVGDRDVAVPRVLGSRRNQATIQERRRRFGTPAASPSQKCRTPRCLTSPVSFATDARRKLLHRPVVGPARGCSP